MKTREKRNIAFLLAVLIFIHGLPVQPTELHAQNELEIYFELNLKDDTITISDALVEVEVSGNWVSLTYDNEGDVYKGSCLGETVSGNQIENEYNIRINADGYNAVEKKILFIKEGNCFKGSFDMQGSKPPSPPAKHSVKGHVQDTDGNSLSDVKILVEDAERGEIYNDIAVTDENGNYEVELANGFYSFIFQKEDYEKTVKKHNIPDDGLDMGVQEMKQTTYELKILVSGEEYGSISVDSISGNNVQKMDNGYIYKCKEGDWVKIRAIPNDDGRLTENTENDMKSEKADGDEIDDGSSYYKVIGPVEKSMEYSVGFEPLPYGLVKYEGGKITYCRGGKYMDIKVTGNTCEILPNKEEHYFVKNWVPSNEEVVKEVSPNQFEFSGQGNEFLKVEYEKDETPTSVTLSGNGIYHSEEGYFWYISQDTDTDLYISLKETSRKLHELQVETDTNNEQIRLSNNGSNYIANTEADKIKNCNKITIRGCYEDSCSDSNCSYCVIYEEISIAHDDTPPKVVSVSINDTGDGIFKQDKITYTNADQVAIEAVVSDNYNVKEIYYNCYEEEKDFESLKQDYESNCFSSVFTNGIEEKEEMGNKIYKINCTIDTSGVKTGIRYLYIVAKDYAGNTNLDSAEVQLDPFIFGKDAEPPIASMDETSEYKNDSNFKKGKDIISFEGIFQENDTPDGLKYYMTDPVHIESTRLEMPKAEEIEKDDWKEVKDKSNSQTGSENRKKMNLYISNGKSVSDNSSVSGNNLPSGSYIVWFYAKDGCGNISEAVSYLFHIDDKEPNISKVELKDTKGIEKNSYSFGNFFRRVDAGKGRIVQVGITANDANQPSYFDWDTKDQSLKPIKPQIEEIRLFYTQVDHANINSISQNDISWDSGYSGFLHENPVDDRESIFNFVIPEEAVFYRLSVAAKDKAGNISWYEPNINDLSNLVMWDQTQPHFDVKIKPKQTFDYENKRDKKKWYKANKTVTYQIKIEDKESGLNKTGFYINDTDSDKEGNIFVTNNTSQMKNTIVYNLSVQTGKADNQDGQVDISYNLNDGTSGKKTVEIGEDGEFTISCKATDNAGNEGKQKATESTIYIDQDKPVLTGITFTVKKNKKRGSLATVPNQYRYFFKYQTEVTVYATDFIGTSQKEGSGVKQFAYYFLPDGKSKTSVQTVDVESKEGGTYKASFAIPGDFKGQIYVQAVDEVGQESGFKNPGGIVIDDEKTHEQHSKAEIKLPETAYKDGEGNPLYDYLPEIKFDTMDERSGIKENAWSIKPFHLSQNEAEGIMKVTSEYQGTAFVPKLSGDINWNISNEMDKNLVIRADKEYQIENQMNHIEAKLKVTDNAGNSSKETISVFSVDMTNPEIKVEYNNNDVLHEKYYKEPRTATITITERNFSEEGVELLITGDGVKKGEWQHHAEGGCNGTVHTDSCAYTCDIVFDEDGEYTLGVNCTDLAGNKGTYGQTDEFVIDLTAPLVMVTYDNNSAINGSYYKEGRVGTIDIEEVNFDEEETIVTVTAQRQAQAIDVPAVSAFTKNEYHNRATIFYEQDGDYTFDIKVTDLAGNEAEIFTPEEFTIDTTPPELFVEGVEDGSANKGVVAPVITYEDINLEEETVSITLTGANLGNVKYEPKITRTENGKKISLGDFKHEKEADDLYTLKTVVQDLAGNETIDERTFSVNRFGSVYILDDSTKNLVDGFYSNQERDLVVTEINVDSLQFQEIVAGVDGELTTLKEGRDFEVKARISDSSWKTYEYHIGAKNFKEEGAYVVTIYSEDRAENKSSNKANGKELEFVIDKTAPSILVAGIEDGGQYTQVSREITLDVQDNILLDNVDVYVDGKVISTIGQEELLESNGIVKVTLKGADRKQSLTVISRDAAGNQAVSREISFLITKNLFVQWYSNAPLFYGSLIGVAAVIMLIFWLQKKRNSKKREV